MNNNELIQQARELCEKATPGPWEVKVKGNTVESHQVMSPGNGPICSAISPKTRNAQFIAASRVLVPQLCDALEAAEAENRWIPVSERLPEVPLFEQADDDWITDRGYPFLVTYDYGDVGIELFWSKTGFSDCEAPVTHWRPIPEPPKDTEAQR